MLVFQWHCAVPAFGADVGDSVDHENAEVVFAMQVADEVIASVLVHHLVRVGGVGNSACTRTAFMWYQGAIRAVITVLEGYAVAFFDGLIQLVDSG